MSPGDYLPRVIDDQLTDDLAVVVEGPRACGKTRTAERQAASSVRLDADPQRLAAAQVDPALVLDGPSPRLLDEWHLAPEVWNARFLRGYVDLVVEGRDGTWAGIEVTLGHRQVDAAAAALRRLADSRVARPPAALVVVTAGEYAYRRDDGVDVVPLGALRP